MVLEGDKRINIDFIWVNFEAYSIVLRIYRVLLPAFIYCFAFWLHRPTCHHPHRILILENDIPSFSNKISKVFCLCDYEKFAVIDIGIHRYQNKRCGGVFFIKLFHVGRDVITFRCVGIEEQPPSFTMAGSFLLLCKIISSASLTCCHTVIKQIFEPC